MKFNNLGEMFLKHTEKYASKTAYMSKKSGTWEKLSYREFADKVFTLASAFRAAGYGKGDKVALLMDNRVEWAIIDYACQISGMISVPIYSTLLGTQVAFIIDDSEAKIVFVENEYQWDKVQEVKKEIGKVEKFVIIDGEAQEGLITFERLMEDGKEYLAGNTEWYKEAINNIQSDDIATIIYTSGTTGTPKGVMLKHSNFLSNIYNALHRIEVTEKDVFLSFLPLSHVFERMAGHYLPFHQGASIAYAESIETVAQNLGEIHPTIMTSVPRFYEKVYDRILSGVEEGSAVKKMIFNWAVSIGKKRLKYMQAGKELPGFLAMRYNLAYKLVFSKLQERVGGKIRFFISGGAPLSKEIGEFFAAADLIILEGYGLTETSPVIAVNDLEKYKFGTVGRPLVNIEVKIAEDGEILTRGGHVMAGYFKNEEATKDIIDDEGWLHTGDIGYFDKDGLLIITDRKKNIIITSGGKNIAPQPIENNLLSSRYIDQVVVVGNRRKFCTALIVPNLERVKNYAKENFVEYDSDEELLNNTVIRDQIRREIDSLSTNLASYETIKDFTMMVKPFTLEEGELTPSLKIKRNVIEKKYEEVINKMYPES